MTTKNDTMQVQQNVIDYFNGDVLAADVWWNKYRNGDEKDPSEMSERHANAIAEIEFKLFKNIKNFKSKVKKLSSFGQEFLGDRHDLSYPRYTEYFYMLNKFENIILGGSVMQGLGVPEKFSSLSNCFVIGQPHDSYGGIIDKSHDLVQLMKRRGGVGLDLSLLRPSGSPVHNQSNISSGPVLFAERYSNDTLEVAQDGRRGALMLSISIKHPNAIDFALSKQNKTKITGANISIKTDREFMLAVIGDTDYLHRWPIDMDLKSFDLDIKSLSYNKQIEVDYVDNNVVKQGFVMRVKAVEEWLTICKCAHNTAEPGIMYEDNHLDYAPDSVYEQYKPITSNPCAEIFMQPYDACRLLALNMFTFVRKPFTKEAKFDFNAWYKWCYAQLIMGDYLIDLELEYIGRIIEKIKNSHDEPMTIKEREIKVWTKISETASSGRRIGAGFTALGDTLAALGLNYSDEESQSFVYKIFQTKMSAELNASIDLAILFGPFEGWDPKIEHKNSNDFYRMLSSEFPTEFVKMQIYGRRNVSWSTAAPAGSQSILTQTTSGIEPLFSAFYKRRKKCITKTDRVDFVDVDGQKFTEYFVLHYQFKKWIMLQGYTDVQIDLLTEQQLNDIFKLSPWFGNTANDIDPYNRVLMQSTIQKFTTHSISSTINLPEDTTVETISKIYIDSWLNKLKGITVYRDKSRQGVMVSTQAEEPVKKRPISIPADYHTLHYQHKTYAIIVGLMSGKPYELFVVSDINNLPENIMSNDIIKGNIIKEGKNIYYFESENFTIRDIQDAEHNEKLTSLFISGMLSQNTPIKKIIKIISKSKPLITAFTNRLIKVLGKYVENGDTTGEKCSECGMELIFENGCSICKNCGNTKC